jgi:hypothetical protein
MVASLASGSSLGRGRVLGSPSQTARRESRQSSGSPVAASMAAENHCADSTALERHACVLGCERTHQTESLADRTQRSGSVDHLVRQLVDVVCSRGRARSCPAQAEREGCLVRPQGLRRSRMTSLAYRQPRKSGRTTDAGIEFDPQLTLKRRAPPWQRPRSVPPRTVLIGDIPCPRLTLGDTTAVAISRDTPVRRAGTK